MATVDVMLHVDESLDSEARERVQHSLEELAGVTGVRGAEDKPHLFVVKYDPSAVNSGQILHRITDGGLHAELVGM